MYKLQTGDQMWYNKFWNHSIKMIYQLQNKIFQHIEQTHDLPHPGRLLYTLSYRKSYGQGHCLYMNVTQQTVMLGYSRPCQKLYGNHPIPIENQRCVLFFQNARVTVLVWLYSPFSYYKTITGNATWRKSSNSAHWAQRRKPKPNFALQAPSIHGSTHWSVVLHLFIRDAIRS